MIRFENVGKTYRRRLDAEGAPREVCALDGVCFDVAAGEFVLLRGPSGSGKTTLLLAAGGMLRPDTGCVTVAGKDLYAMSTGERARFRAEKIGFVFQMYHLVPYLDVLDNVLLAGEEGPGRENEARELLARLRLDRRLGHKPSELSAGEKQRVAFARALLCRPALILADEPTGNLDPDSAAEVEGYLADYHRGGGTVVVVSHSDMPHSPVSRRLILSEGRAV